MRKFISQLDKFEFYSNCEIQTQNIYLTMYNSIPNEYKCYIEFDKQKFIDEVVTLYSLQAEDIVKFESYDDDETTKIELNCILFIKDGFLVETTNKSLIFYYDSKTSSEERQSIIAIAEKFKKQVEEKKYFHMVCKNYNDLDLKDFEIKHTDVDSSKHYNDDFFRN